MINDVSLWICFPASFMMPQWKLSFLWSHIFWCFNVFFRRHVPHGFHCRFVQWTLYGERIFFSYYIHRSTTNSWRFCWWNFMLFLLVHQAEKSISLIKGWKKRAMWAFSWKNFFEDLFMEKFPFWLTYRLPPNKPTKRSQMLFITIELFWIESHLGDYQIKSPQPYREFLHSCHQLEMLFNCQASPDAWIARNTTSLSRFKPIPEFSYKDKCRWNMKIIDKPSKLMTKFGSDGYVKLVMFPFPLPPDTLAGLLTFG